MSATSRWRFVRLSSQFFLHAPAMLLLTGLAMLPVAGCLTARPCALDESDLVFENPLVQGDLPWWKVFTTRHYFQYTPITFLSNRLNADVFGLDAAWSFRLINWLIHAFSACLLWRLLGRLGLGHRASLFVACAWAAHPMACESVAWIAERSNALAFLFGVVALWAYTRWYGRWEGIAGSSVAFAAALLSKPLALGWLPVFFALEALGGPDRLRNGDASIEPAKKASDRGWWRVGLRLLPLVALALILLLVGLNSYETADRPPPGGTWFTALLTDSGLYLRYVWNTLVPVGLSAMYAIRDIVSLTDGRLWVNLLVWLVLIGGSVALAGSRRRVLFGWLWFFGGLGPACNVVAIGYPMQDRYAYIASAGLLLVCAEVASGLMHRGHRARTMGTHGSPLTTDRGGPGAAGTAAVPERVAAFHPGNWVQKPFTGPALGALYIVFLSVLSLLRAPLWADNFQLMQQAVEREPDGVLPHIFFGKELEWKARELEWNAALYPPEAYALRRAAAEQYMEGLRQADAYTFDPFPAMLLVARNWVLSGKYKDAIELLNTSMPDPGSSRIVSKYGLRHILVPEDRFGFPYSVPLLMLGEGHYWLGEAHLAWACEAPRDQCARLLDRVCAEARNALAINPACYEAYALLAKEFLFQEALQEDPSQEGQAIARARLALTTPQLDRMGRIPEILKTIAPPVPAVRVPALGCLAMARAAFEASRSAGPGQDDHGDRYARLLESLSWARRAAEVDPRFGEGFWLQAEIHLFILRGLPPGRSSDAAEHKTACIRALEAISAGSPRYIAAQRLLESLTSVLK